MQKKRFYQNITIIVLGVAIILMSFGYATSYAKLEPAPVNVNEPAVFDIHFDNPIKLSTTTINDDKIIGPTIKDKTTSLSFTLNIKPGETYEFTTDVVNAGTLNAKLCQIDLKSNKENIETDQSFEEGITYKVVWDNDAEIRENEIIKSNTTKKLKAIVTSNMNEELIDKEDTYSFTLDMNFVEAF